MTASEGTLGLRYWGSTLSSAAMAGQRRIVGCFKAQWSLKIWTIRVSATSWICIFGNQFQTIKVRKWSRWITCKKCQISSIKCTYKETRRSLRLCSNLQLGPQVRSKIKMIKAFNHQKVAVTLRKDRISWWKNKKIITIRKKNQKQKYFNNSSLGIGN